MRLHTVVVLKTCHVRTPIITPICTARKHAVGGKVDMGEMIVCVHASACRLRACVCMRRCVAVTAQVVNILAVLQKAGANSLHVHQESWSQSRAPPPETS